MKRYLGTPYKHFFMRFSFFENNTKINIEQIAVNETDLFPRNVRRLIKPTNNDIQNILNENDGRIYELGNMEISIRNDRYIYILWIFEKSIENNIKQDYGFKLEIDMNDDRKNMHQYTEEIKNAVNLWRLNNLFDQHSQIILMSDNYNNQQTLPRLKRMDDDDWKKYKMDKDIYVDIDYEMENKFTFDDRKYYDIIKYDPNGSVLCKVSENKEDELMTFDNNQMKEAIFNRKRKDTNDNDHKQIPKNYDGILESIDNDNNMMTKIDDQFWKSLDEMDDVIDEIWVEIVREIRRIHDNCHRRDRFNDIIFTLVSLKKIQSVISILKGQINDNKLENKTMIIAI